jgi:hypothetical protein
MTLPNNVSNQFCYIHGWKDMLHIYKTSGTVKFLMWYMSGRSTQQYGDMTHKGVCHGSGSQSLAPHHTGPDLIPAQTVWDLSWTVWL